MWQSNSKIFRQKFITIGWDFSSIERFPHADFLSADTETKLYYNGNVLTDDDAYNLYRENGQEFIKKNVSVHAYAFMLSDGEKFALFQNAEDFLTACSMFLVKKVFWYNAKFDFSIFDYYFLTNEWTDFTEIKMERMRKLPDKSFISLNGDFGQRYQLRIWKSYLNTRYQKHVHNFIFLDICNIFGGGLRNNLEAWNIKDRQGKDVRKLEMDYAGADIENDIQYMINDTKGLHLLAEKINETMKSITGFSLFDGDYLTAGGLAKKTLLKFMFNRIDNNENIYAFKLCFPITKEEDVEYRENNLYLGGKCLVNPYKRGVVQQNIYKYDVNSMYPAQMRSMLYPFGKPKKITKLPKDRKNNIYIVCLSSIYGCVKNDKIPVWQDTLTGDYVDVIRENEKRYIWLDELEEIEKWYDLDYDVEFYIEFEGKRPKGTKAYIDTFYEIKAKNKGAIRNGSKLMLNSAYGKIAQRIEREICTYELNEDGIVHLVKKGTEIDENSMLSVVVGSRITSLARVSLMTYIREICGNVRENFIYCDTDSVASLTEYDECSPTEIGKMKFEGLFKYGLFLAPKSYILFDGEKYEVHCKGVNVRVVESQLYENGKPISFSKACEVFKPNKLFKCLCGLNVKGGKALIYVDKMILNEENFFINKKILGDLEELDINNM